MTEQLRQSLSAVIDGEADAFELRRVLDELERDPELRATWDRYHLIGSVLRGERTLASRSAARALSSRVPQAVRESSAAAPAGGAAPGARTAAAGLAAAPEGSAARPQRTRRAAVGVALAASVALAGLLIVDPFEADTISAGPQVVLQDIDPVADPVAVTAPARAFIPSERAPVELAVAGDAFGAASQSGLRRTHAYMLQHAQQQGLEQRGVISLVKMATYEAP